MTQAAAFTAFLLLAAAAPDASAQGLFKCTRADGRVVYQDTKCDDAAKQSELKAPAPAPGEAVDRSQCPTSVVSPVTDPKTGMETDASRISRGNLELVVEVFTGYDMCVAEVPGFQQRYGAAYREWQGKFAAPIASYQGNALARTKVECARKAEEQRSRQHGADVQGKTGYCMGILGPVLEKLNREGMPR